MPSGAVPTNTLSPAAFHTTGANSLGAPTDSEYDSTATSGPAVTANLPCDAAIWGAGQALQDRGTRVGRADPIRVLRLRSHSTRWSRDAETRWASSPRNSTNDVSLLPSSRIRSPASGPVVS